MLIQTMSTQDLRSKATAAAAVVPNAEIKIVGLWVWVKIAQKPAGTVIEQIKALGYRWSVSKRAWYIAGGHGLGRKYMSWKQINSEFETEEINQPAALAA